jgi:hypothetical protein
METHGGNSATRATDLANGAVTSVTRETSSVCTIGLDLPDWLGHRAGQHVDVRLTAEDGYTAEREYSIASAPDAHRLTSTPTTGDPRPPGPGACTTRAASRSPLPPHTDERS